MALNPTTYRSQNTLQPGARGEIFQANLPGYRNGEDRINRTNRHLEVGPHDVLNTKYSMDFRLPSLFTYGFAFGYNQIVIPKGRIVAIDPFMDLPDTDMQHMHNTVTLANGGCPVRLRNASDKYPTLAPNKDDTDIFSNENKGKAVGGANKEWIPVNGFDETYNAQCFRPFKKDGSSAILKTAGFDVDVKTGKVVEKGTDNFRDDVRPGNIPIGILERNEYTRDEDAFNGMMPGPISTDKLIELPLFAYKDKAEQNPWGSAYGGLFPGALLKSDENGRFTISPLSIESELAAMNMAEYEAERQQVIGQVYKLDNNLLPEATYKFATWALEDRRKYDGFNPLVHPSNNRRGEDAVSHSPYKSTGKYPGYPYDPTYGTNDLNMINSKRRYSLRMDDIYQYDNLGIPGLTDGYNAVVREFAPTQVGYLRYAGEGKDYVDFTFQLPEVDILEKSLEISLGEAAFAPCTEKAILSAKVDADEDSFITVQYADEHKGLIILRVSDKSKADDFLKKHDNVKVSVRFKKRGMSGVPTFMDWDGCVGSIQVLLTK